VLADDIARAKAKALDDGEAAIAQSVADLCAAPELTPGDIELLRPWLDWAKQHSVRHAPAKPYSVARFIIDLHKLGFEEKISDALAAIERLHDKFGLSNPVLTAIVGAAVERVIPIKSPRSWPKADKALFATLPPQIRHRIEMREDQRDKELRRMQNEHAKLKELQPNDEPKAVEQKEKETTNESLP